MLTQVLGNRSRYSVGYAGQISIRTLAMILMLAFYSTLPFYLILLLRAYSARLSAAGVAAVPPTASLGNSASFSCWAFSKASLNKPASGCVCVSSLPRSSKGVIVAGRTRTLAISKPNSQRLRLWFSLTDIRSRVPHPASIAAHIWRKLHIRYDCTRCVLAVHPHNSGDALDRILETLT